MVKRVVPEPKETGTIKIGASVAMKLNLGSFENIEVSVWAEDTCEQEEYVNCRNDLGQNLKADLETEIKRYIDDRDLGRDPGPAVIYYKEK